MMKKFLLLVAMFSLFSTQVFAKDIPYVTNMPYKPYTKEIKLKNIDSQTMQNDLITIEKNKFEFKYIPNIGYAYEYLIVNNTENDIILKGINSNEFYNEDLSNKSNKPLKNLAKASLTSGQTYIPFYGIYYGARCDLEKNSFIRDFPENQTIKAGDKIRILASATKNNDNPQAEFVFIIDNQDVSVKF